MKLEISSLDSNPAIDPQVAARLYNTRSEVRPKAILFTFIVQVNDTRKDATRTPATDPMLRKQIFTLTK